MLARLLAIAVMGVLAIGSPAAAQVRKLPNAAKKEKRQQRVAQALDQFAKMSPAEREKVLSKLPPERREQIERNLKQYNSLTPEQRENLRAQYDNFQRLSPEQKQAARRALQQMNEFTPERRVAVRREVARLRQMPEEDRKARLGSAEYRDAYSADERRV